MDAIKKSLDELFSSLPRNAAAKRIKAEMLENLTQRYEELASDLGPEEAQRQVIAEIGPAEEIREAISLASPKKGLAATVVQCAVIVLCIGYIIFVSITVSYFKRHFIMWPTIVYYCAVLPLLFFFGTWLVMKIINHYAQPKGIYMKNKLLRHIFLIISIAFLLLFVLMMINSFVPLIIFLAPRITNHLLTSGYPFGIAAALLYLGIKK